MKAMRIYLSVPHMGGARAGLRRRGVRHQLALVRRPPPRCVRAGVRQALGGARRAGRSPAAPRRCTSASALLGVGPGRRGRWSRRSRSSARSTRSLYLGARPVFLDSERATWNLDPALLEEYLARRAPRRRAAQGAGRRAPVRPARRPGPDRRRVRAHTACCSSRTPPRRWARPTGAGRPAPRAAGAFSFNGNKIITTTGGGMLVAPTIRRASRGCATGPTRRASPAWSTSTREIGYNYRMSNVLAGIGRGQLECSTSGWRSGAPSPTLPRRASRDLPGLELMPRGAVGHAHALAQRVPRRPGAASRDPRRLIEALDGARTSRPGRSGSRCTCSRCSPTPSGGRGGGRGGAVLLVACASEFVLQPTATSEQDESDRAVRTVLVRADGAAPRPAPRSSGSFQSCPPPRPRRG